MTDALLVQESPQGRWVLAVPAKLVRLLAALGPKRLDYAAVAWAVVRGEMEFGDWSLDEVRGVLAGLAELSQRAEAKGESLLMCLPLRHLSVERIEQPCPTP
jgi:hypothetical protein